MSEGVVIINLFLGENLQMQNFIKENNKYACQRMFLSKGDPEV